jgi:hypothetical protein
MNHNAVSMTLHNHGQQANNMKDPKYMKSQLLHCRHSGGPAYIPCLTFPLGLKRSSASTTQQTPTVVPFQPA